MNKQRSSVLAGNIDSDYHRAIGLLLYTMKIKSTGDPLAHPLVPPYPMIKGNREVQQPNAGSTVDGPLPSLMQVQITLPCN